MTAKGIRARIIDRKKALTLTRIFMDISLRWTMEAL
jgi:hypothetical protein